MWRTLIFILLAVVILYVGYSYTSDKDKVGDQTVITNITNIEGMTIEDIKVGTGAMADAGKMVSVHYVGTLMNGTKFDSSRDRGTAFTFKLGNGDVIEGWDKGVAGMKIGGLRKLTIPPDLGYGDRPVGPIPANSTLVFEVELLDVK